MMLAEEALERSCSSPRLVLAAFFLQMLDRSVKFHDGRTRELLLRAGFAPGQRFVQFGCGLGCVTRWAAGLGAHATAIDLNPEQVAVADGLAREACLHAAHFRLGSVYEPNLEPDVDMSYSRWLMVT